MKHECQGTPCRGVLIQLGDERKIACPFDLVRGLETETRAYAMLKAHGVLPAGGGWLDQTEGFLEVVSIMDSEVAAIQAARMKHGAS